MFYKNIKKGVRTYLDFEDGSVFQYLIEKRMKERSKPDMEIIATSLFREDLQKILDDIIDVQHQMIDHPEDWKRMAFEKVPKSDSFNEDDFVTAYKADIFFLREFIEDTLDNKNFVRLMTGYNK